MSLIDEEEEMVDLTSSNVKINIKNHKNIHLLLTYTRQLFLLYLLLFNQVSNLNNLCGKVENILKIKSILT